MCVLQEYTVYDHIKYLSIHINLKMKNKKFWCKNEDSLF